MLKIILLILPFCVLLSCVSPDAIKTDINGIRNDLGCLEELVDQKADNFVVAEQVDQINNRIEQTTQLADELFTWRKNIEADTINYSGAGWVVAGTCLVVLIFVGAGIFLIRTFIKRTNLLTLLTCAIQKTGNHSPEVITKIKEQLKIETSNGGPFTEKDRKSLGKFAKNVGTFAKQ